MQHLSVFVGLGLLFWLCAAGVSAQYEQLDVPAVAINNSSVTFQASLYPEHYQRESAARDMRWVARNDSAFTAFWEENGNDILQLLTRMSGIDWVEERFEMYIVRYYPAVGGPDPLVIPLGGMRRGELIRAAASGNQMKLNVIYQLAHRMLAQAEKSDDPFMRSMTGHPLMRPGAYRRDNLAMLLALVTSQQIIGLDSTYDAYQSSFWKARTPGRQVLEQYMLSEWILSPDRTLAQWVIEEPYSSRLVVATRQPRRTDNERRTGPRPYVEGLPLKGKLGFSVRWNATSKLQIDQIDYARLGYASGLQEGDVIRSVDGVRARNQRDMVQKILAGLDEGGSTVTVERDGQRESVIIQPYGMFFFQEQYWEDYDSLYFDMPVDTTSPDDTLPRPMPGDTSGSGVQPMGPQ
ncbi:hypothetical protein GF377_03050 [candidate division GN15 bacterium]|nr:hypothetical protein [candidate division GN15 bacterium]